MRTGRWACVAIVFLTGCAPPVSVYGLRPEYPKARLEHFGSAGFVRVVTLRPVLQWATFPDADDRKADTDGMLARVRNVTYDLKIFCADQAYPAEVVYARSGIREPAHLLEVALRPDTEYFWTVRARFELDGAVRVTPWSRIRASGSTDVVVPTRFYFGMKTPPVPRR